MGAQGASTPGPIAARIKLGGRLRRLRESQGITADQAAKSIGASDSKISRIELGRHGVREIDVADLLAFYGVSDAELREELLNLASLAGESGWWHRATDLLPSWFGGYLGLEEAADSVASYDPQFVPGLLQTAAYAAGLLAASQFAPDEVERLLAVRAERLRRFADRGWRLSAVIEEAVLYRQIGADQVLRGQLEYLLEVCTQPGITVGVRPLAATAPAAPAGFILLRFDDPDLSDVVYTEQLTGATLVDRPADVGQYSNALELLAADCEPERTAELIETALNRLG